MAKNLIQSFCAITELYMHLIRVATAEGRTPDSYTLPELMELARLRLEEFKPESGNELAEGLLGQCDDEFSKYARKQYKQIKEWLRIATFVTK